jgi:fluoride exporter
LRSFAADFVFMLKNVLLVGLGGGLGSILRYISSVVINRHFDSKFPLATLAVNITGSLLIGIVLGFLQKNNLGDAGWKYILAIGFCGGFTTFSAFAWENANLINNSFTALSLVYVFISIATCIFAVFAGIWLIKIV